jgi:hypothetical protein
MRAAGAGAEAPTACISSSPGRDATLALDALSQGLGRRRPDVG